MARVERAGECLGHLGLWHSYRRGDFDDQDIDMLRPAESVTLAALVRMHGEAETNSTLPAPSLSSRESEVARLIRGGATDKDIVRALGISYATVQFHVGHLMRKLVVSNRTAVAVGLGSKKGIGLL